MKDFLRRNKYSILGWSFLLISYIVSKYDIFNMSDITALVTSLILLVLSVLSFSLPAIFEKDEVKLSIIKFTAIIALIISLLVILIIVLMKYS